MMAKRVGTLLLAATVVVAGVLACPRGALCGLMRRDPHRCCQGRTAVRASDCCPDGTQLAQRGPISESDRGPTELGLHSAAPFIDAVALPVMLDARAKRPFDLIRGVAPPGPLLAHHTALLL